MTELIWDGKYDKDGRKIAPVRLALPFQNVETVNESVQDRQKSLDLFSSGHDSEWRNRLIWGDKKYVLPSLLSEFAGKVNLIYIDPPFDIGADFSFTATIPDNPITNQDETSNFVKEPNVIEQKAYRDTWGKGLESYLQWFYETLTLLRDLLANDGSLYVHIGPNVAHYVKVVLDEVFGFENYLNQIIWKRTPFAGSSKARANKFPTNHDCIFLYRKDADGYVFKHQYIDYTEKYKSRFKYKDERGFYRKTLLKTYSEETEKRLKKEGRWIDPIRTGAYPSYRQYLHESKGKQVEDIWPEKELEAAGDADDDNVWEDVNLPNPMADERTGYPTQKPEELLERIIQASSKEQGLVLDCFCGSGTTAVVAEKLNRRWITCDLGRFAIHTARKRLLSIPNVKPFVVQNLGKYERQTWQSAEFTTPEDQREKELRYRRFILDLYKADPVTGYSWLHGVKNGRMVHVGSVDAPVTLADIKSIAAEVWRSVGKGKESATKAAVDVLGWDFALEVNEVAKQIAAESKVDVSFKIIPREVLEKKAVEQGDIRFFELASLSVEIKTTGMEASAKLKDFVIPPQDVPEEVQKAITHWSQWIDYWAIDWDYKNDTFHNQWQSFRTRKDSKIALEATHNYETPGEYQVVVKVIDILGNDTTKLVKIKVAGAQSKKQKAEATSRG